jgi:hypothetical protein
MAVLLGEMTGFVPKLEPLVRGYGAFVVEAVLGDFLSVD